MPLIVFFFPPENNSKRAISYHLCLLVFCIHGWCRTVGGECVEWGGNREGGEQRLDREKMGLNGEYGFQEPIPGQLGQ